MYSSVRFDAEVLVSISGRFDGSLAPVVFQELNDAVVDGASHLVVDLSEAGEIDEGGVAVLCAVASNLMARGGHISLSLAAGEWVTLADPAAVRAALS